MFKKKLLVTALALSSPAFVYTSSANAHGYVKEPASRAYICSQIPNWADKINKCGGIAQEPQSVEAPKTDTDFPADGKIASGGNGLATKLDNEAGGWPSVDIKSGWQQFKWHLTQPHSTTNFKYYITKEGWSNASNAPLTRSMFDDTPFCESHMGGAVPSANVAHNCNVPDRTGNAKIYAVWRINDTGASFYQILDVKFDGEVVVKPEASISAPSHTLTTSNLTLDGSGSKGKELSYSWKVTKNADKVTLENSQSNKASIRLKSAPQSDFEVEVELTVTDNGKNTSTKKITLKAVADIVDTRPTVEIGKDFSVNANSESRGYDLGVTSSTNAKSFRWTIKSTTVEKGAGFALQKADKGEWVQVVDQKTARALVKPGTIGKVTYTLTAWHNADFTGEKASKDITVTVKEEQQAAAPVAVIGVTGSDTIDRNNPSVTLDAMGSKLPGGVAIDKENARLEWSTTDDKIMVQSASGISTIVRTNVQGNFDAEVQLKVTDSKTGKSGTTSKIIKVRR